MTLPLIIGPNELAQVADPARIVVFDLSSAEQYAEGHLPGARHLEYGTLVRAEGKANGLLPTASDFSQLLARSGVNATDWVVAYDQNGGGAASRLIWTLHAFEHYQCSLLAGGLTGWLTAGQTGSTDKPPFDEAPVLDLKASRNNVINTDELMQRLADTDLHTAIMDARSLGEFNGTDVRSERGGHIPGAIHLEWTEALDKARQLQLLPDAQLLDLLQKRGFESDQTVVVYCQTHQRSSLSYVMLRHLGYSAVLGLEGAWSEWGNRTDTPIEVA